MDGCLKGLVRLGCLAVVAAALVLAWVFREPILGTVARWLGPRPNALPPVADIAVGAPTPADERSAWAKLDSLARRGGPDSVILTPNEMAALVGRGIDWTVRRTFDSLRVELLDGEFAVHARLDTSRLPPDALGPFRGMLGSREPFRIAGPLTIERPGRARWRVRELSLRGFTFPGPVTRELARRVAGASDGAVPIHVDRAVADLDIQPTGVVLYRRARS